MTLKDQGLLKADGLQPKRAVIEKLGILRGLWHRLHIAHGLLSTIAIARPHEWSRSLYERFSADSNSDLPISLLYQSTCSKHRIKNQQTKSWTSLSSPTDANSFPFAP
ncbi:hypothetical protein OIU85_021568 [Salix viminalis]|uniref:Uncharacterized protein n=1 Tax=Salix viminalis TaxID=40686 RepID=A0A9Q0UIL5_SALVM|nr:hypothetical protein OIU85_021568 [Salix viminalis]